MDVAGENSVPEAETGVMPSSWELGEMVAVEGVQSHAFVLRGQIAVEMDSRGRCGMRWKLLYSSGGLLVLGDNDNSGELPRLGDDDAAAAAAAATASLPTNSGVDGMLVNCCRSSS